MSNVLHLRHILNSSAFLSGETANPNSIQSEATNDLNILLHRRLERYYDVIETPPSERRNLPDAQLETVLCALDALERVQEIVSNPYNPDTSDGGQADGVKTQRPEDTTALGTRDMGSMRTLLALVFRWGTDPAVKRVSDSLSGLSRKRGVGVAGTSFEGGQLASSSSSTTTPVEDFKLILSLATR